MGTEATRAGIIELLFKREFLSRKGKSIISTDAGEALIACLPDSASLPDMTAQWECHVESISQREASYASFMQPLEVLLESLVGMEASADVGSFQGLKSTSKGRRKKPAGRKRRSPRSGNSMLIK